MKSRLSLAATLLAVLVPLAGCGGGGGGSGSGGDPAKVVPASAPVYAEATIRPSGSKRDDAEAAAKKLLRTDNPGDKLTSVFDKALKSSGLSWDDVKPWLGERVGVFFTSFAGSNPNGAAILDSTNDGKARDTLDKGIHHPSSGDNPPKVVKRSYKGVDYEVDTANHNNAAGVVDGYAVIGTEAGLKQVVDTAKGGKPLTTVPDFTSGRQAVGADKALAQAWADPQQLLDAIAADNAATQAVPLLRQVFAQLGRTVAASFTANGDALRLQAAALGAKATGSSNHSGAGAAAGLPSDAWLAIGIGDLGKTLRRTLGQVAHIGQIGNVDVGGRLRAFESRSGLNVQRDLLSWMGDGAIYARGKSLVDLGVVLTASSTNPARSKVAARKVAHALHQFGAQTRPSQLPGYESAFQVRLPGLPVSFFVASSGERFSIGVNPQALSDVAHPSSTLGSAPSYKSATDALGSGIQPAALIDFPTILQLLEGFGIGSNPSYAKAKPYLQAIGVIAAGAKHEGDTLRASAAVALR